MTRNNYSSHWKKYLFPGFPGSGQGKAKSGFFPHLLPSNFFTRLLGTFCFAHQCLVSTRIFFLSCNREFLLLVFWGVNRENLDQDFFRVIYSIFFVSVHLATAPIVNKLQTPPVIALTTQPQPQP